MRAYVREHLAASYQVVEAEDGEDGLAKAREVEPDLVISDVMMPRMDGLALLHALRQDEALSAVPVILLTARAAEADRLAGLEAKADDYLTKPFSAEELKVRVRNLIETRQALRARYSQAVVALPPEELDLDSADAAFLENVRAEIESHLDDGTFGVEALAEALFMSKRNFRRRLKALTGETPSALIREMRLRRAQQLIEQQARETVAEVAHAVGFSNVVYFSRLYRKRFGYLPSEYA